MLKKFSKKPKTLFRQKIYEVVKVIPAGEVFSYKKVAQLAGRPKAGRVVGNALDKNTDLKIPCHRVVKSDGSIGGYRYGVKKKITLLKKEGVLIKGGRIVL